MKKVKALLFDIETSQMLLRAWGLGEQYSTIKDIKKDWEVISVAAKWLDDPSDKIMYQDLRQGKKKFSFKNEKKLLKFIWKLLDEADIVITQNGKRFDVKKLNARFIKYKMQPPSSFEHFDTYQQGKKHFGFTSHKLEYMAEFLEVKYKKLKHKKFPGTDLWIECIEEDNTEAWQEMKLYNMNDVLTLQAVYERIAPWCGDVVDFNKYAVLRNPYHAYTCNTPKCESTEFFNKGTKFKGKTPYRRLKCKKCGNEVTGDRIK